MKQIFLVHPETGVKVAVKNGFSWTMFFWGFFVPIFRGDWKLFWIILVAGMFSFGISNIIFAFKYNKMYVDNLKKDGYVEEWTLNTKKIITLKFNDIQ